MLKAKILLLIGKEKEARREAAYFLRYGFKAQRVDAARLMNLKQAPFLTRLRFFLAG